MDYLNYYVYLYLDPRLDPITPIYVGKGKGKRAFHHLGKKCTNVILKSKILHIRESKLEPIIFFVKENMSCQDALDLEKELIANYGRICNDTGILCNFTEGGEGTSGFYKGPMSIETKEKLRKSKIGKKLTDEHKELLRIKNIGKKMSPEAIQKTRLAHIGKKRSQETCDKIGKSKIGFKFTEESKLKISLNSKQKKPIIQLDLNNNIVKYWESIASCCKNTGYTASNISICCSGKRKTAFGYKWKFQI